MSDGRKYYCICDSNCKFETMTKEQILSAIAQAVETGSVGNCDTGFVTKVKETNGGGYVTFWVGTRAQYNAIEKKVLNCMYIITDDTTSADILKACENATAATEEARKNAAEALSIVIGADIKADEAAMKADAAYTMASGAQQAADAALAASLEKSSVSFTSYQGSNGEQIGALTIDGAYHVLRAPEPMRIVYEQNYPQVYEQVYRHCVTGTKQPRLFVVTVQEATGDAVLHSVSIDYGAPEGLYDHGIYYKRDDNGLVEFDTYQAITSTNFRRIVGYA